MISSLIEAALRSVLVAIAVWAGLRVLRVSNVLAQKAAWGLVLATAIFMPLLLPVAARLSVLPSRAALVLPPDPETLLGKLRQQMRPEPVPQPADQSMHAPVASAAPEPVVSRISGPTPADAEDSASQPATATMIASLTELGPAPVPSPSAPARLRTLPWRRFAFPLYAAVAAFIVLRLAVGMFMAFRIRLAARPVSLADAHASGLRLFASPAVSSPVTIGSSIILPADYESWDIEKLNIVLAHERSHIRQGDFYLQLLAGIYAALFWFSPLGWWLKHKLSDLAEAISDRAGLQQAASRASYAQILLEFAAAPRPTLVGVAMARTGSISRRIERLLNDSSFRLAFAGTRRRALIAVLLVPAALFAATALVRVQAAGQASAPNPAPDPPKAPAQAAAPKQPEAPIAGVSTPEEPSDAEAPSAVETPSSENEPPPVAPQVAPLPPRSAIPSTPRAPRIVVVPRIDPKVVVIPPTPRIEVHIPQIDYSQIRANVEATIRVAQAAAREDRQYRYVYSSNGDSYGIVRGNGEHLQFSGDLHTADIDKIRKLAHGDFLWFKRDGKYYYVEDPATLAEIEAMYKPMELLGKQQEELGRQQEELGKKQEELGRQQEQVAVPTPDVSKEIAEINAASAKLQSMAGKTVTQQELADLQSKLGDLQGRLGSLQGEMGAKQGDFGAKMGALGAQQGKLGAQQGKLGAEQGRLAQQADQKVKSIIDQSLQNGKAHPVN
jgi:BlaR1 peptidase M56